MYWALEKDYGELFNHATLIEGYGHSGAQAELYSF